MQELYHIAERILFDLQSATGKDIGLIDHYGRLIACSAVPLQKLIEKYCEQMETCRDGEQITDEKGDYSLLLQKVVVREKLMCYVAIGGSDGKELRVLAHTTKWLAQMLLSEHGDYQYKASAAELRKSYFADLLFSKQSESEVRLKAASINMDPDNGWYVAVLCLHRDCFSELDTQQYNNALGRLTKLLMEFCEKNPQIVMLNAPNKLVLVGENLKVLELGVKWIAGLLDDKRFQVRGGISARSRGHFNLRSCFNNASTICMNMTDEEQQIMLQDECLMELLMEQIPVETKEEFVEQVFGDCPDEDVDEWARIVQVLSANNGSINRSATELFMHKNTLQYRLMRVKERIGLDARVSQEALVLQIAFMVRYSLQRQKRRQHAPDLDV